jgi:hypothetical protein
MSDSLDEGGKLYEMLLLIDQTERGIHDILIMRAYGVSEPPAT